MSNDDCLSESATKDLVKLLVKRGHFHQNVVPELAHHDKKKSDPCPYSDTDVSCQLVATLDDQLVMTKEQLQVKLMQELSAVGGRMSVEDAATALAVDPAHIEHISSDETIMRVGDHLITEQYFDAMAEATNLQLVKHDGHVVVSDLAANVWNLPMELTLSALEKRIESKMINAKLLTLSGMKVLVTPFYEERERCRIRGAFRAITLPTNINSVCHEFHWDCDYVVPILQRLCSDGEVVGEVHVTGSSSTGAMYIPTIYLTMQRQSVDEFFASNGYITAEDCLGMGILESNMGAFVQESNPTAIVLPNTVILRDVVVSPVEQALVETIASDSFLDLRLHLPDSLMQYEQDVKMIVQDMALTSVIDASSKEDGGCIVMSDGEALFVSQGMTRHIAKTLLPPLIESFAKTRAEKMKSWSASSDVKPDESAMPSKKKGRKTSRKAKAALSQTKETAVPFGVVPLVTVAKTVAGEYPDLADIQAAAGPLFDEKDVNGPVWEQDGDLSNLDANVGGGPLYELCRVVLYNDQFQSACELAVKAELERLDSVNSSTSVRSRKDGATKMRSIESAFEDPACFGAACFAVQEHAKFLQYFESLPDVDEKVTLALREDFLDGCCADFTGRITHYCLFKNEIEDTVFCIDSKKDDTGADSVESDLPEYCQPFDCAARRYPSTKLSCSEVVDGEAKLPLPTLRVVLSGGVGVQLARMWTLCGGQCYEGGTRVNDDGTETIRQGSADGFLPHVEENCLTLCGIPFKKLDKKSEKQYLFARRKALTAQLEATNEPKDVLELTVMLLFQQVKSLVVSGPLLIGPILALLQKERKISDQVSTQLQQLADAVKTNATPDGALVTLVKECGLSRDISKHTMFQVVDDQISCPNDICCGALEHLQ